MKYDFKCSECSHVQEVQIPMSEFDQYKADGIECEECGGSSRYSFNPQGTEICFKGFQWADKNYREKEYRKNRSAYMAQRQKKNNYTPTLAPNYKGERTKNWKEAREEAKADGKFHETYDRLVKKEESGQ